MHIFELIAFPEILGFHRICVTAFWLKNPSIFDRLLVSLVCCQNVNSARDRRMLAIEILFIVGCMNWCIFEARPRQKMEKLKATHTRWWLVAIRVRGTKCVSCLFFFVFVEISQIQLLDNWMPLLSNISKSIRYQLQFLNSYSLYWMCTYKLYIFDPNVDSFVSVSR